MKIIVTHSSNFDYVNKLYTPLKESSLWKEHQFRLPHDGDKAPTLTKELMKGADLVIAEVSEPSTGQGIELGWADVYGVPIVCLSEKGSKVSHSLFSIPEHFIEYEDAKDMIEKLGGWINKQYERNRS